MFTYLYDTLSHFLGNEDIVLTIASNLLGT